MKDDGSLPKTAEPQVQDGAIPRDNYGLLPCPCCGGDKLHVTRSSSMPPGGPQGPWFTSHVTCQSCFLQLYASAADVLPAWNRRSGLSAVRRETIEAARKAASWAIHDAMLPADEKNYERRIIIAREVDAALSALPQGLNDSVLRSQEAAPPRGGSVTGEDGNG